MKKLLSILTICILTSINAQSTFNRLHNNQSSSEGCVILDGVLTPDGSSVGVGYLGTNSSHKSLIIKFTSSGDTSWVRYNAANNITFFSSVAIDSDGEIAVTGFEDYDAIVAKFDQSGNFIWGKNLMLRDMTMNKSNEQTTTQLGKNRE